LWGPEAGEARFSGAGEGGEKKKKRGKLKAKASADRRAKRPPGEKKEIRVWGIEEKSFAATPAWSRPKATVGKRNTGRKKDHMQQDACGGGRALQTHQECQRVPKNSAAPKWSVKKRREKASLMENNNGLGEKTFKIDEWFNRISVGDGDQKKKKGEACIRQKKNPPGGGGEKGFP